NLIQVGTSFKEQILWFPLILFVVIGIASDGVESLKAYITGIYSDYLIFKFNEKILTVATKLELQDFENPDYYDLMQRAEVEASSRPFAIINSLLTIFFSLVTIISYVLVLFFWKWWTIIIIMALPIVTSLHFKKISRAEHKVIVERTSLERKSWYLEDLLNKDTNVKEVKLFNLEEYLKNKYRIIRKKFLTQNRMLLKKRGLYTYFFQVVSLISSNIIVIIAFLEATIGKILIGNLMTYINAITKVKENTVNVINTYFALHQHSLYASNINTFFELEDICEKRDKSDGVDIDSIQEIKFINVSFKYPTKNKYALENINLKLERGKRFTIVGQNGSGKSTLAKLILGFYSNYEGEILINGISLRNIDMKSYRKANSAVFQDFVNYHFSIKENISISNIKRSHETEAIKHAATESGANDFIQTLDNKYDQQLGYWFEDGIQLSGGEWQKLAIARAFFKDADVIVMDEPAAALDAIAENNMYKNFSEMTEEKIGIFITHRIKKFDFVSEIIVLKDGKIIGNGKHIDLVESNDVYKDLYYVQSAMNY
ncbi:ABC transporter ATP-binding protein, partial [Listeria monocytogenes]|nr:ABC transporter ATP-binding protein [Listeria monocytogenes]